MGPTAMRRQKLRAEGRCLDCGKLRPASHAGLTRCPACIVKHKAANTQYLRTKRLQTVWGDLRHGDPLPFGGGAPRLQSAATMRVCLNRPAWDAVNEIKRGENERALRSGEAYQPYQLSRLVREVIRRWTRSSGGYRDTQGWMCFRGLAINFHLDAETLAIVDREARAHFGGSRSATVRAMLVTAVNPPPRAITGRPRIGSPDYDPRWDD